MKLTELIKEIKEGSIAAQKCFFDLYAVKMMVVCKRYMKNHENAEERLQDGFYKFFKNIQSFKYNTDAALFQWLKTIMVNECLMALRKKNVFDMVPEAAAEDISVGEDVTGKLAANEILKLIVQLPVGYRTVFNLYIFEGMDHKDISKALKITESASRSQLTRAKALLQKMVAEQNCNVYEKSRNQ